MQGQPREPATGTAPLKIVIPIHRIDAGGVERVALRLARAWDASGHDVTIVLGAPGIARPADAPHLRYWQVPSRFSTLAWRTPWMIYCLYSYLMEHRADLVFYPGNTYAIVSAALKVLMGPHAPASVLKVSNALVRRDMPAFPRRGYGRWLRMQGALFDRIVGLSEAMRREIHTCMQPHREQVVMIPNPVLTRERLAELARITRPARPLWTIHYLAAGRLVRQKNYPLMLRAFARAARPADRLTIAGEGAERPHLERLCRELGIARQVEMVGEVASIDPLLARADALVLSSDYEGLPGVVVEALGAGLPVLATDCCVSMTGLVEEGRTGLLVPCGDETALAEGLCALRDFKTDPVRARARAAAHEVEAAAARYIAMMRDLTHARAHYPLATDAPARINPRHSRAR